jgi:RND family efflux transporter MFP subunit
MTRALRSPRSFHPLAAASISAALLLALTACGKPGSDAAKGGTTQPPSVLSVEAVSLTSQQWPQTVQANGALAAWQEVIVAPETGGLRVAELLVDVGARVKRGQLMARLADDSLMNDLHKQQATVAQAQATLEQAVSNVRRAKMVEGTGGLSAQSIDDYRITEATARASLASAKADLASTELKLRQTRIVAPDDGMVSTRTGILGNVVSAGTEMFRLVRQSRVEWQAEVDAQQLAQLHEGQRASVTLPDGRAVQGKVRLVGPVLSTSTGRGLVYVSLPTDSPAKVGMFGKGALELPDRPARTLPQTALVQRDGRNYVYQIGQDNKVKSLPVTIGRRLKDRVEVLDGVAPEARLVASGGAFLSDGATVTVVSAAPARSGASAPAASTATAR